MVLSLYANHYTSIGFTKGNMYYSNINKISFSEVLNSKQYLIKIQLQQIKVNGFVYLKVIANMYYFMWSVNRK